LQLAHWISTNANRVTGPDDSRLDWECGSRFFPTFETLIAQFIAAVLVIGSIIPRDILAADRRSKSLFKKRKAEARVVRSPKNCSRCR